MMFATASSVVPHIKDGKVRALVVASLKRTAVLTDIPTIDELRHQKFRRDHLARAGRVRAHADATTRARRCSVRRTWSYPQEPTGEEWWADVLADPRARKRDRRTDLAVKQAFYRLADEKRETILVAYSKCDWRAAFSRDH